MHLKHVTALGVILAATLLGACRDDDHTNANNAPKEDSFIAVVKAQTNGANAASDEAEPIDIMAVNETRPEDNEPQSIT